MNEEKLLRISLIGSILGLLALYFIVLNISSVHVNIGEVTGNYESGEIRVVLWENLVEELKLGGMNVSGIRDGARLEITGTVELYRGKLEVIPLRSQVKFIN